MDLKEFSAQHGGLVLAIRRHFESRKVRELDGFVDRTTAKVLRLARHLDDSQQGLSFEGEQNAWRQGQRLVEFGLIPVAIVTGTDDRNLDGGLATAEGIFASAGPNVSVMRSPGITYPYYGDTRRVRDLLGKYGDDVVALHLSGGRPDETRGLWTEAPSAFEARLTGAVDSVKSCGSQFGDGFELWDVNFEQMVLLRHRLVTKSTLSTLSELHEPLYGAGIAVMKNGTVTEFTADLEIGPSTEPKS